MRLNEFLDTSAPVESLKKIAFFSESIRSNSMPSEPSTTWPSRTMEPLMRARDGVPWNTPPMLAPATKVRNAALAAGAASRWIVLTFTSVVRSVGASTDSVAAVAGVGVGDGVSSFSTAASTLACSALRLAARAAAGSTGFGTGFTTASGFMITTGAGGGKNIR